MLTRTNPFAVGDIVRLKTGEAPILVTRVSTVFVEGLYLYSDAPVNRHYSDIQPFKAFGNSDGSMPPQEMIATGRWDGLKAAAVTRHLAFTGVELPETNPTAKEKEIMANLFQTNEDKPRFGTQIAKNSEGKIILEMKGEQGAVEAFAPEDLTEVTPYTVALKGLKGGQRTHHEIEKGKVSEGDFLFSGEGHIFIVAAVDTKERNTTSLPKDLRKIVTEEI